MTIIDVILVLVIFLSIWSGWHKGFIIGVIELVSWVGGIILALLLYQYVASFIDKFISKLGVWSFPVAFILTIIIVRIIISLIADRLLRLIPPKTHTSPANHALGLLPGIVNGLVYSALIATLLLVLPISNALSAQTRESKIANLLSSKVEWLETKLSPVFDKAVGKSINKLTIKPKSNESIRLPFKVTETKVRTDLEAEMLEMVNRERQKKGLKLLKADPELAEVARAHSADMFARSYFSHITPDGNDPFFRMRKAGVKFLTAGENLALAQTLTIAHNGLMNSPGHRANILHPAFGRLGIGILDGGIYGLMITQNFRN